jgi:hypothetical protein
MIDHTYRCIFIHQRKCAGSAIIQSFGLTGADMNWHVFNNGTQSGGWYLRPRDYFVFAVVRNPFDRAVSSWRYLPAVRRLSLYRALKTCPRSDYDLHSHFTRPQVETLRESGRIVPDALIRFENLQADFDVVCDQIGKPRVALPVVNASKRDDYLSAFDWKARRLAESIFRDDLAAFGYEF